MGQCGTVTSLFFVLQLPKADLSDTPLDNSSSFFSLNFISKTERK